MKRGAALLVIDMQREFCDRRGYAARTGMAMDRLQAPIPQIARLIRAARLAQITVIYTREGHRPDLRDLSPAKRARSAAAGAPIGSAGPLGRRLIRGEAGHEIIDALEPRPGETVIDKPGYGAFYATDLELILRNRGISLLYFTGVTTDVCVHSTLREAVDRGFECITVSDGCAASDPAIHAAMLACIGGEGGILGAVGTTEEVLASWDPAAP
jgi:nicotinamidase-related amidase